MRDYPEHESVRSQRQWLLPLAIGGLVVLAVIAGVLLVIVMNGPGSDGTGQASASSEASATPGASGSVEASASIEPTPVPVAVLPNRAIAEVIDGTADVHTQPGDASPVVTTLNTGDRVFVIGEPRPVGDMRWYRVAVVHDACGTLCEGIGWVAAPLTGDSPIVEVAPACPTSPMTDKQLERMPPLESLHCYGRNGIVVTGIVETPCCGYVGPYQFKPAWLAEPVAPAFLKGRQGGAGFRHAPDLELDMPERGDVVRVVGHFEDPAAIRCRQTIDPDWTEPVKKVDQALAVLTCRVTFVWTAYEVTGHEELGPCCGVIRRDGTTDIDRRPY